MKSGTETAKPEYSVRRWFLLTCVIAAGGFVFVWPFAGFKIALAFLLGAAASFGNLYLFDHLSRAITPGEAAKKPWQTRAFLTRYLLLFAGGYAIVRALDVSPLAVVLGLLASTAAVISSILFELFEKLLGKLRAH
jgi:hypothetical protein